MKTRSSLFIVLVSLLSIYVCRAQQPYVAKLDSLIELIRNNDKGMGSISVFKDGKEIYGNAYGFANVEKSLKANKETLYRIGSISKVYTASIIMKLSEQGKLSTNDLLSRYYPQIKNADKITIEQLLRHRSGIFNFTNLPDYLQWNTSVFSKQKMLEKLAALGSDFEPGSKYQYSNSNYILLSLIAEDAGGKSYNELLNDFILKPCGLTHTRIFGSINPEKNEASSYRYLPAATPQNSHWALESETDPSVPLGAGFLLSTPSDMNRFIWGLQEGKIVKSETLKLMTSMQDGYGLGLSPYRFGLEQGYGHGGSIDGFQSTLFIIPGLDLSVAITSNGTVYPLNNIAIDIMRIVTGDPTYTFPVFGNLLKVSEGDLQKLSGNYSSPELPIKLRIFVDKGVLHGQGAGQLAFPLECFDTNKFRFEMAGIIMHFNPESNTMILKQGGKDFTFTKE